MSEMSMFDFEGTKLRVVLDEKGEPWFVGQDVAAALGYLRPADAITAHVHRDDSANHRIVDSIGRNQKTNCINESGLYALIMSSRLESAQRFKRWVTSDVLPTIRKTGSYGGAPRNALKALPSTFETQIAVHSLIRDQLVKAGVTSNMASAAMLRACVADELLSAAAEREYRTVLGVDWDDSPSMTPTQIGKELGGLTPIKVNKMLETRGLQKNAAGPNERPRWEPTEEGKSYCGAVPFKAKNDHHGMQLKWSPAVLEVLREPLPESHALPEQKPKPQDQLF